MPRLHPFTRFATIAVLAVLLLAGCGKKGPLYLPDNPPKPDHKMIIFVQACFH
jgi:predicted small lipoprotein YifL